MSKWLILLSAFLIFLSSCNNEPKIDDAQLTLINEVLLPIYITDLHYKFNIQMQNQDKIESILEYDVDKNGKRTDRMYYTYNEEGKLFEEYKFLKNGEKSKTTRLTYDDEGRLSKVITSKIKEHTLIFVYGPDGLLEKVTDSLNNILTAITFESNETGDITKINQDHRSYKKTSAYNFLKIDNEAKSYLTNYVIDTIVAYDSMPYAFNKNGTLQEVLGLQFDDNGIPDFLVRDDVITSIEAEVDENGNWTKQSLVGGSLEIYREITYK